jgi:hypothetical protein
MTTEQESLSAIFGRSSLISFVITASCSSFRVERVGSPPIVNFLAEDECASSEYNDPDSAERESERLGRGVQ